MSGHMGGSGKDSGRSITGTSRLTIRACALLAGTAVWAGLLVHGGHLTGDSFHAAAQEMSGIATVREPAGNGTGDAVRAFDPTTAGVHAAGQGAALLASLSDDPPPFDINNTRSLPPAAYAPADPAPAVPAPAVSVPAAQPAVVTPAVAVPVTPPQAQPAVPTLAAPVPGSNGAASAPAAGAGAPETGASTPGAAHPGASTPASAHAPSGTEQAAPSTVATKIGELIATQLPRYSARANEQQALAGFYAEHQYQPVFTAGQGWSTLGALVLQQLSASWQDGLQPSDYAITPLSAHPGDAEIANAELKLASTLLLYARHAQAGRFNPAAISPDNVDVSPTLSDPNAVLVDVTSSPNPAAALGSFAPQYDEYRLLRMQLVRLEAQRRGVAPARIPAGPTLRPGDEDPRVPALRARLGIPGAPDDRVYSPEVVEAVRAFQRSAGERPDGTIGPATLAALNGTGGDDTADIIANMERWRWLPHAVAPAYVIVNIPEYMVRVVVNEQTIHETRVVVGKPENPTPLLSDEMEYAVFNPSWNVPPGIIRKEMLPKLQADPYALERQGIDVVRNGRIVDPGTVDWSRGTQGYAFRQPPGERNALGNMKFMFPNKHSVYLHDTPSRALFARDKRAFSHGCVRVNEPMKFAEVLFSLGLPGDNWPQQRISKLIGGNEKYLNLKQRLPVHLAYFTTYVDANGRLVNREDIYGINAAVKATLGLGGTAQVADRGTLTRRR